MNALIVHFTFLQIFETAFLLFVGFCNFLIQLGTCILLKYIW